ncbi:hypothetical protein [Pseudonocardia sp. ICBG601]|uniref:hypothetical protein n=1 Tax=Pseudonocardia sp. ICBG601 TaxID=2846759 RepID=UPI001CF64D37|nr:hypothetical protein [Pseudonocardia sp. ICBG601]
MDVAPGCCAIVGDDVSDQGTYLCRSTTPINVAVPPKPASGQREHLLVARVRDSLANGVYAPAYEWSIELLEDPGSGRPELPGSAIELATVTVSADAVSVTAAAISDLRQRSVVGTPALSGDMYASGMHPAYGGRDSTRPLTWMKNPDGWVVLSGWVRRTGGNYTMRANQTAWFRRQHERRFTASRRATDRYPRLHRAHSERSRALRGTSIRSCVVPVPV